MHHQRHVSGLVQIANWRTWAAQMDKRWLIYSSKTAFVLVSHMTRLGMPQCPRHLVTEPVVAEGVI